METSSISSERGEAQLAELGREAAREACASRASAVDQPPTYPNGLTWAHVAYMRGLLDCERLFSELEWRVVVGAYRDELHVLACDDVARGRRA